MDEQTLVASLETYNSQIIQIESALQAAGSENNEDLVQLRQDLTELVNLTQDSLLSLKKSQLLSQLHQPSQSSTSESTNNIQTSSCPQSSPSLDDEFAAFKAAIADTPASGQSIKDVCDQSPARAEEDLDSSLTPLKPQYDLDSNSTGKNYEDIVGTKCRAPYDQEWGGFQYHNCMIVAVETAEEMLQPMVRVMFCQPTQKSMQPCPFYLEDRCRFEDDKCRFSHGYQVEMTRLKEYLEPDYSNLSVDTDCLAKDTDGVWYKAKVIEDKGQGHSYQIMFDTTEGTATVDIEDIIPFYTSDSPSSQSDDEDPGHSQPISEEESDPDDELPVYLWRPNQSTSCMGEWETHTKGIGSRLMSRMGYVAGQGLGRHKQGRTEPVPIQLLPQGKSLDKIMELKQIAGDQDLYDVLKRQKKTQRKVEKKAAESYDKVTPKASVFDFINKRLGHNKGDIRSLIKGSASKHSPNVQHISEKQLTERSDRQLNFQMLRTHEAIAKAQKEIVTLEASVQRHKHKEPAVMKQYERKLSDVRQHLKQLQSSHSTIQSHQQSRHDHKKLTIF